MGAAKLSFFEPIGFHAGSLVAAPSANPEGTTMPRSEAKRTPERARASSWHAATRQRGRSVFGCRRTVGCGRPSLCPPTRRSINQGSIVFGFPDMILSIKLKPEAGDEFKLRFEEVDVLLFIAHQFFKQVPGHVILGTMAIARRLLIKGTR